MKLLLLTSVVTVGAIGITTFGQSSQAQSTTFYCGTTQNGIPATQPGQNAAREIQQLFNIRSGASRPLQENANGDNTSVDDTPVVDLKQFLENAPVVESSNANSLQPANQTPALNPPPSNGNW